MADELDPQIESRRLAAIVESSDDAIVSKDLDGTIRSWNPAAERIFRYSAEEMVGTSIFRLIPPELHDEEHHLLATIRAGGHVAHYETDRIRKDGVRIRISLTLSPLHDGAGRLIGASAIKRDVTRQRLLEAKLQQAERMEAVGRLAGGIVHDFNNLLTVIGGLTTMTLRNLGEGSQERLNLEQVIQAAERASALTGQLLTFSRQQIPDVSVVDLNAVVRTLVPLLHRLIGEHIAVRVRLEHSPAWVHGNQVQLEQIIMNLALNARDAMPDGGTLTIESEILQVQGSFAREQLHLEPGRYVVLAVADTGVGMDALTQANIFEPFFSTKAPGQGTGLGLATVHAIVRQAGGAVQVYSEPGQGSVFRVYLAPAPAPEQETVEPGPAIPRGQRAKNADCILLVEDEPGVRSFVAQALEEAGYGVLQAGSGEDALAQLSHLKEPPTMLITDVVLPGMNGRVLAERLRVRSPDLRVLYISGYTSDMMIRAEVGTDSITFLQKPFTPDTLLDRVRTILGRRSRQQAALDS